MLSTNTVSHVVVGICVCSTNPSPISTSSSEHSEVTFVNALLSPVGPGAPQVLTDVNRQRALFLA